MDKRKLQYIGIAVMVVMVMGFGYFGITLPKIEPPAPLDTSGFVTYDDLEVLENQIEAIPTSEEITSFSASAGSGYSTNCYMKQGGEEWIADSGCTWGVLSGGELEIQSGATLDVQSGATVNLPTASMGNTTITGTLVVSGTSDLVGAISSSTGAVTVTDNLQVSGTSDLVGAISSSTGAVTVTDNLQVNGNTTLTGTLTLESVAFSGPVVFGSASSVVSGTTIAHGLAVTPTSVILTPGSTTTYTSTVFVLSTDATSITLGVEAGVTVPTVYWMAGK